MIRIFFIAALVSSVSLTGTVGHAAAAERRCEFRFDHEKPAWIGELTPKVRQSLANMMGQMMVLQHANNDIALRRQFQCGCYMDHVDWDAVLAIYPEWYRTEPIASGKLAEEHQRMWNELSTAKTLFRRKHCL